MSDGTRGRPQRDPLEALTERVDALVERLREVSRDREELQIVAAREREMAVQNATAAESESTRSERDRERGRALRRAVVEALEELRAG